MPVYNQFIATTTRRKNKPLNEGATAGGAKTPRVGVNKSDIEAQAAQQGWKPRPLSMDEISSMSSAELRFHEIWNKEELDAAFKREAVRRAGKDRLPAMRTRLMWTGHSTLEEDEAAPIAGETFAMRTLSFARTLENARLMCEFMERENLDGTKIESYNSAFRELVEQGKITPLEPESADEFLQKHPELRDTRIPPMIEKRQQVATATADFAAKTEAASARAGSTTVVNYEDEQTGYPQAPTKYSFRKLLDSMDAESYARRLREDAAFAAAVELHNGKQ